MHASERPVKEAGVFDTSFWAHVYGAGLLPALRARFQLRYTVEVADELPERYPSGQEFRRLVRAGELVEVTLTVRRLRRFSAGERSAIDVAMEHPDWLLLLDDRRPHAEAARLGLRVLCSPLLVVDQYRAADIDAATALRRLAALAALGTLSPLLVRLGVVALAEARAARRGG